MNRRNLRFIAIQISGYWTDSLNVPSRPGMTPDKEGTTLPYMEIGVCSAR